MSVIYQRLVNALRKMRAAGDPCAADREAADRFLDLAAFARLATAPGTKLRRWGPEFDALKTAVLDEVYGHDDERAVRPRENQALIDLTKAWLRPRMPRGAGREHAYHLMLYGFDRTAAVFKLPRFTRLLVFRRNRDVYEAVLDDLFGPEPEPFALAAPAVQGVTRG